MSTHVSQACSTGVCSFGRQAVPGENLDLRGGIALVGEAPGYSELKFGRPWVGRAGKKLDELLGRAGLHREGVTLLNTCACVELTREDKRPLPAELEACRPRLLAEVQMCDPRVILLMGNTALSAFLPGFRIGEVAGTWRAWEGRVLVPTYHPSHLLRGAHQVEPVIIEALNSARRIATVKEPDGS